MPARAPYIPRRESDFDLWARHFAATIAENPGQYALTPADAEKIAGVVANWRETFNPLLSDETKTRCTVAAKKVALKEALGILRGYAQQISRSTEVNELDKGNLGINPGKLKWTRIDVPDSWPCLHVLNAVNLRVKLRYFHNNADSSAKPYGAVSCQVFYTLSPTRITSHAELVTQHTATRSPFTLDFPASAGGRQCYLAAYWLLRNGKRGQWGPIISFTVPSGG